MEYDELLGWHEFFSKRPIGWREDQRVYMLLSAQGIKEKSENLFPSIAILKDEENKRRERERVSGAELARSQFFKKMMNATGGDNILDVFSKR